MTTENIQPPNTLAEAPDGRVSSGPSLGSLIESLAFESKQPDRGYTVRASYLNEPRKQDALIEIFKDSKPLRAFFFPAYKVWNIAAHFRDIVDGEIAGDSSGYEMAAWDGITNSIILLPREQAQRLGQSHGRSGPLALAECSKCRPPTLENAS